MRANVRLAITVTCESTAHLSSISRYLPWIHSYKNGGKLNQLPTDREVSDILAMKDLITKGLKVFTTSLMKKALSGKQWPGAYKLVEVGTSRRTITDPDAAAKTLLDNGYREEDIFKPREPRRYHKPTKSTR